MPPKKQGSRGKLPSGRRPPPGNRPSTSGSKVSLKCRIESSDDEHNTSVDFFDFLPSGIVDSSQPSTQIGPLTETVGASTVPTLTSLISTLDALAFFGGDSDPESEDETLSNVVQPTTTPSAAPHADVQVEQDPSADVAADKGADQEVDKGLDKGSDELFAEAVGDEVVPSSSTHLSGMLDTYPVNSRPFVLALWARLPLLRAQLTGFLQELDDFERSKPKDIDLPLTLEDK